MTQYKKYIVYINIPNMPKKKIFEVEKTCPIYEKMK